MNDLSTLPLNIACESLVTVSEEDNISAAGSPDLTDQNLDQKPKDAPVEKSTFREMLQDRVLRRLQEKVEYGRSFDKSSEITSIEQSSPAKLPSNDELWKRVEGRLAAKKAVMIDRPREEQNHVTKSPSNEDIKTRIRSLSRAMGLASSIQSNLAEKKTSNVLNPADLIHQAGRPTSAVLDQPSSVYEETLSQGRFMEDDYFSIPSVGSTQSLFSNISEYKAYSGGEDALAKYLAAHSNILQDTEESPKKLTDSIVLEYFQDLKKAISLEPAEFRSPSPAISERSATPTNSPPPFLSSSFTQTEQHTSSQSDTQTDTRGTESAAAQTETGSPRKETACQWESDTQIESTHSPRKETGCQWEGGSVLDADCQTSLVLEDRDCQESGSIPPQVQLSEGTGVAGAASASSATGVDIADEARNSGSPLEIPPPPSHLESGSAETVVSVKGVERSCSPEEEEEKKSYWEEESDSDSRTTVISVRRAETIDITDHTSLGEPAILSPTPGTSQTPVTVSEPAPITSQKAPVTSQVAASPKKRILDNLRRSTFSPRPGSSAALVQRPLEAEVVDQGDYHVINIPCDVASGVDPSSNIQVMVNIWSQEEPPAVVVDPAPVLPSSRPSCDHHEHKHTDGVLMCESIPQFDEQEVDQLLSTLQYEDEEKKRRMEELFEELDNEHLINSFRMDLSLSPRDDDLSTPRDDISTPRDDLSLTPQDFLPSQRDLTPSPRDLTPSPRDLTPPAPPAAQRDHTAPRNFISPYEREDHSISPGSVDDTTGEDTPSPAYLPLPPLLHPRSPSPLHDSDEEGESEFSLPAIPSALNSEADLSDWEQLGHQSLECLEFPEFLSPSFHLFEKSHDLPRDLELPHDLAPSLQLELSIAQEFEEYKSRDADLSRELELSLNLSRDLIAVESQYPSPPKTETWDLSPEVNITKGSSPREERSAGRESKINQTLAIPFRLVRFLPPEQSDRECWDGMCERAEGNNVAVQVDMRHVPLPTARQELNLLDRETQRSAKIIDQVVHAS